VTSSIRAKTKVLYITGDGRSGSTLLDLLLGQSDGFFSTGELSQIWRQAFIQNLLCGCGKPFRQCNFWNAVVEEAFGGWHCVDAEEIKKAWLSVSRLRNLATVFLHPYWRPSHYQKEMEMLTAIWEKLYSSISKISGASMVVDSSKWPVGAFNISQFPNTDLFVLHLTRDSRAVAFSMQRKKRRPEVASEPVFLPMSGPSKATVYWNATNMTSSHLRRVCRQYMLLRYEDLVAAPAEALKRIAEFTQTTGDFAFLADPHAIPLKGNHTVAGNPLRFQPGPLNIRLDDEWKSRMPWRSKALVTAMTFPLLWRYGYL
jgi:hypothetical protein